MLSKVERIVVEAAFKYSIRSEIPGTAGLVYVMEAEASPRRIAVKTINPEKLREKPRKDLIDRFKRELEKHYAFGDHPSVLRPFEVKIIRGWPYIALPFCDQNLRQFIESSGPEEVGQRLAIAIQAAHALVWCRSKNLVTHQDLKPENILLQDNWRRSKVQRPVRWHARLSDFGLANAFLEVGLPFGSRPYMAPEQYERHPDFSKVDVFALGVIFTELFAGRHPIGEHTANLWPNPSPSLRRWGHETPWKKWSKGRTKLREGLQFTPPDTRSLVQDMLATDPGGRPEIAQVERRLFATLRQTDAHLAEDLKAMLSYFDALADESIQSEAGAPKKYSERQLEKFGSLKL